MKRPSDPGAEPAAATAEELRDRIIGLGERSGRKSYYPELRARLATLERFRALLDQTNDAILLIEGAVTDANEASCRLLDRRGDELVGLPVREISAELAERVEQGRPGQLVARLRTRTGREVPVEATVAFREDGAAHRVAVVLARDVSERLRSERALRESEERFRAVFECTAVGLAVVEPDGRVRSTNPALQQLLGESASELRGRPFLSLIQPEDRARFGDGCRDLALLASERASLQARLARADGQVVWAQVSTSTAGGDEGAPAHLVVAVQDVTLSERAQEALEFLARASVRLATSLDVGETLRNLVELAVPFLADACAASALNDVVEHERRVIAGSDPEQQELLRRVLAGRAIPSALGMDPASPLPRLFTDAAAPLRAAARDDPSRLDAVARLGLRSAIVLPLRASGRTVGALLLATGRSRRQGSFDLDLATEFGHRAALALENAGLLLKAQEASRVKDEFLAIVSHELRTPLTTILGWVGLLRAKSFDPGKADRGLAVIERNARSLAQIIDDLLSVSRIVAGKLEVSFSPTDLAAAVEAAVLSLRPAAEENRVAVHVQCEPGTPVVMGDAARLQQVVWNLVSNAIKYTPPGGEVRVLLRRAGPAAELTVSDTGRGIGPRFLPHVFERFSQADSSTTRRYRGLGLGLTIVQRLVELHGGTVHAASEGEGRGACFTITVPLADPGRRPSEGQAARRDAARDRHGPGDEAGEGGRATAAPLRE